MSYEILNINGKDCDQPPFTLKSINECSEERLGSYHFPNYYLNVTEQSSCDTPSFLELQPITDEVPEGYRLIYIDEILNNAEFRQVIKDNITPYKHLHVINGIVAGRPYHQIEQQCEETFTNYRHQYMLVVSDCFAI